MAQTAIITGAAQGIGRAIALQLAEDGCNVVLNDLAKQEIALQALVDDLNNSCKSLSRAAYVLGDVSKEEDVKNMIEVAVTTFGALNIMVANAGVVMDKPMVEVSAADWDRVVSVNAKGTFLCIKLAGEQMIKQGNGGRIIAASSVCGKKGFANASLYCASKFAVRGIVQCAALELGTHKITVNAYAPGPIQTPMLEHLDETNVACKQLKPGQWMDGVRQNTALKEIGKPEYIANMVSFLASEKGCYITGETVSVDAGMMLL